MAKISVVIPLYNKGPYIARALNSVLNQTFQDFEVVVVNDGSTDEGAEFVKGFLDPRIRMIHQENRGVSVARNRGVETALTEFIAFLDADDEWLPRHLETLWRLKTKYPDAGAYTTAYLFIDDRRRKLNPTYRAIPPKPWEGILPSYFRTNALGDHPISSSSVAIPKSIFNEIHGFKIGEWYGEDESLWGRIALKYPIIFSWDVTSIYHLEASNRTCNKDIPPPKLPFILLVEKMVDSGKISEEILPDLKEYIVKEEIARAYWYALRGRMPEATEIIKNCHTKQHVWEKYRVLILAKIPMSIFHHIVSVKRKIDYFFHLLHPPRTKDKIPCDYGGIQIRRADRGNNDNLISIIITSYNRASILEKTLPSYLNQKDVDEILIVDDGSNDKTKEVVKNFQKDPRVKYINHAFNQGEAQAKLTGISVSTGKYIIFGEDDVFFGEGYSNILLENLNKNDADICAGRIIYLKENETFSDAVLRINQIKKPLINYNTLVGTFGVKVDHCTEVPFVHACCLVKREKITEIDFDVNYGGNEYREETDAQISMLKNGCKIIFCPNAFCYHLPRSNKDKGGQWSRGQLYYLFWTMRNNIYFLNKHYDFLSKKYSLKPKIVIECFMLVLALQTFCLNCLGRIKRFFLRWNE